MLAYICNGRLHYGRYSVVSVLIRDGFLKSMLILDIEIQNLQLVDDTMESSMTAT